MRLVSTAGRISFRNHDYFISHGLVGQPVGVRPTTAADRVAVWYGPRQVATLDLTEQA